MYDYIIIGQGIAGTLLAHFLLQSNKKVAIIDNKHHQAASMVAAGLVNPITGRNFVKSWRIDELIPFAVETYQKLEKQLEQTFFEAKPVAMLFNSIKTENDWLVRSSSPDIENYVTKDFVLDFYTPFLEDIQNGVEFQQSGRVQLKSLIEAYQQWWQQEQTYLEERFEYKELEVNKNGVRYKELQARRLIFAEGYQATQNPYFNYLPFGPAKGDILIVRIPNYPAADKLVKHGVFIIHLKEDIYWIGSTYNRDYKTIDPMPKAKASMEERLRRVLKLPFEVLEHQTAVRPTVRDRRPFIGQHPQFESLYLFNGMGAKGSYLAPFFADQFVNYLEKGAALDKEVNIVRYERFLE